jgi:hypothetical protein
MRKRLTLDEHIALGQKLIAAHRAIGECISYFPKQSRGYLFARSAEQKLVTIRSLLDDEICGLTDKHDPRNLATHVYYGSGVVPNVVDIQQQQEKPGDAFAGWSVAGVSGN